MVSTIETLAPLLDDELDAPDPVYKAPHQIGV